MSSKSDDMIAKPPMARLSNDNEEDMFVIKPARGISVERGPNGLEIEKETTLMEVRWTRVTSTK